MKNLPRSSSATANAKALRKQMTPIEQKMWYLLRDRRLSGYKFRRQQPIGPYIVDFYCDMLKLVIEVDGSGHMSGDRRERDQVRDRFIESQGVRVVRFLNNEVTDNLPGVLERILREAENVQ
jgi:very-short-patch-repair endonuclease